MGSNEGKLRWALLDTQGWKSDTLRLGGQRLANETGFQQEKRVTGERLWLAAIVAVATMPG